MAEDVPTTTRIAIAARKGGVGKTTICCGVASLIASEGVKTLLIDLDPQSNAAFALGVDPAAPGTAELVLGRPSMPQQADENLWVYAGGPSLQGHQVAAIDSEELRDLARRLDYQVILFDCPPGDEHLERLGLVAADRAIIALDAHPFAMIGAARVIEVIQHRRERGRPGPTQWALVQSRIDLRRTLDRDLEQALRTAYPEVSLFRVRQDSALAAATTDRKPIAKCAPEARGTQDLREIVKWLHG